MCFCHAAMKRQCHTKTHGQVHWHSMPQISEAFQSTSLIAAASSTSRVSPARRNWVQRIGPSQWLSCVKLENAWKIDEPKVFHWIVMAGFRSSHLSVFSSFWATVFVRPDKFQICYEHCAAVRQLLFCRSCGCLANIIAAICLMPQFWQNHQLEALFGW